MTIQEIKEFRLKYPDCVSTTHKMSVREYEQLYPKLRQYYKTFSVEFKKGGKVEVDILQTKRKPKTN